MTTKRPWDSCFRFLLMGLLVGVAGAAGPATTQPVAIPSDPAHPIAIPEPDAAGGGWADGGPSGAYFANPDFSGQPAFTRHDDRVDFDWGKFLPIGGSPAEPYKSFPHSQFSVRWTGRVVPRFSESYVFMVRGADGAKLKLKPAGAADWIVASHQSDKPGTWFSQPIPLAAGQLCDVVLEYANHGEPPAISLHWSSPSAPDEVVDPVAAQGLNAATWVDYCWADAMKTARYNTRDQKVDANGYPTTDCQIVIDEGAQGCDGVYDLSFKGKAQLGDWPGNMEFSAGKQTWKDKVPYGEAYDAATNTTHVSVHVTKKDGLWQLKLTDTSRAGGDKPAGDGVTDIHLMRPIAAGSDTPQANGQIVYTPFLNATAPYTALRWLEIANAKNDADWTKRSHADAMEFTAGGFFAGNTGGECWEMLIALANQSGKDLYVTLPMQADDAYIEKFAKLVRYGSDGREPYDHEVANPVWPPLNPNLRLYAEVGNEIWNWAFGSTQYCLAQATQAAKDKTPDGKIIDYDGKSNWRRFQALRIVHASGEFRKVFGDSAMGSRIRLLLEYQYNNANNTAGASFSFLDDWYNNDDGNHVPDPHPVRYWVWGGGGATYYGVANPTGEQTAITLPDPSFENGFVADGSESAAPAGSGWTLTGDAAIYRNHLASMDSFALGQSPIKKSKITASGCTFRVDKAVFLRSIGCWLDPHAGQHDVYLLGPQGVIAQGQVQPLRYKMSESPGWVWVNVAGDPKQLQPGVDYQMLVTTGRGGGMVYPEPAAVVAGAEFKITGAIKVTKGGDDPKQWKIEPAGDGSVALWPVGVLAGSTADSKPTDLFEPVAGGQAAVMRAGGVLSTKIKFTTAGHYALTFHAAGPTDAKTRPMPFTITIDGKSIDPIGQAGDRGDDKVFNIGGFERRTNQLTEVWGSAVFDVAAPGEVELKIAAIGKGKSWTVFDDFSISSVDAIMESGFGAGQALGQVAQNNYTKQLDGQASYARSFGLPVIAYEAGWSLGGDFNTRPIQIWCKFHDPRATSINNAAESIFQQSGGFMGVWGVYTYWPGYDTANALSYPLMKSVEDISATLPAEPTNGITLPAQLQAIRDQVVPWGYFTRTPLNQFNTLGEWKSWLTLAPSTGVWSFAVHATGDGVWELEVDGVTVGRGKGDGTAYVSLVKGIHGVRLRNRAGTFTLEGIDIAANRK